MLVFGQEQVNFEAEVQRIDSLIEARDYQEADTSLIMLRQSLENTSLLAEDTVQLYFISKLAFVNYRQGDCKNTIAFSKEEVDIRRTVYGDDDLLTLSAFRNLGVYYLNCDSVSRAKETLEETLSLHKQHFDGPDEVYVRTLDDLAFTYGKLDESELAIQSYEELISLLGDGKGSFYLHVIENYSAFLMSLEKYEEASVFFEDLKDPMRSKAEYPVFLRDYYNVFVHVKDYVRALETASQIALFCETNQSVCSSVEIDRRAFILSSARLSMLLSKYEDSKRYYSMAEAEFAEDPVTFITILGEEAQLFELMGSRGLQLSKLNIAIGMHRKNNMTDSSSYSRTVLQLGKLYTEIGRFKNADELFTTYIRDLESKGDAADPLQLATAYQSLGNQRYFLQNFKDADLYLTKAKELLDAKGLNQTDEYASVLNSLGALYEGLVNYRRAEGNYREALKIVSDEPSGLRISLASNLANVLTITDPSNDSINSLLDQAIAWQLELTGESHPTYANMLGNRGAYYQENERYEEAEEDLNQALKIFEYTVGDDHPQYLTSKANLGLLLEKMDRKEEALDLTLETKQLYDKYYPTTHPGAIRLLNNLANLYIKMERFDDAEPLLMELSTIQVKEINDSFSYLSESEKKSFVEEKKKVLDNFKGYVVARTVNGATLQPEVIRKWYDLELSTKGILLNSTKKVRDQIFNSGNEELIGLFSEWTAARKQIADMQSLKSEQKAANQIVIDSLLQRTNGLEKEISRISADFTSSFKNTAPTYEQIRSNLAPAEASVEIIRMPIEGDALYVALIGTAQSEFPEIVVLGKGQDLEGKAFTGYKNKIAFKVEDVTAFETYWKAIHTYLSPKGVTKIYYAPDGVYHKISLVTLYNPTSNNYLLDEVQIVQLTSTKDLIGIKTSESAASDVTEVLLVGRPSYKIGSLPEATTTSVSRGIGMHGIADLPGTEEEVQEIGAVLEKNGVTCKVRMREEANEKEIKELLNTELVHIATHGFFTDTSNDQGSSDPMINAGLLLAGVSNQANPDEEDGILTAYEIMNLELSNTNMIVLSACETALGEIASGEGIYGLQRAFFVGGAKTLIMSLWKVDDEATRDLMTAFYKEFMKKGNKREAFLTAQQKIKKKYKSPVYWGAFVMLGG